MGLTVVEKLWRLAFPFQGTREEAERAARDLSTHDTPMVVADEWPTPLEPTDPN